MSELQSDPAIGDGWQHASLGKLLPLKYGKSLPAQLRDSNGTHPVYGSSGMVGTHSAALTNGPTLIVGRKGNVGAIHYSAVPCWPIDTAYFVEAPVGHNLRYYKYLLESLNLVKLDRSTAIPGLSRDDYNAVTVSVAPPEQQDEIVAEIEKQFSRLDESVANLQRVKANLKRYKASVLKDAVEGRLVPTEAELARREGRSFETGEQLLQRILETRRSQWRGKGKYKEPPAIDASELPDLPEGWTWCGVEHVAAFDKNALKAGPFGSALKKAFYVDAGYKIYGQEQVIRGDADFGDYFIDEARYLQLESCAVRPGDVLVSLVGTAGKVLVLPEGSAPGIINPRLIKLSLNLNVVLPEYIAYVLQSPVTNRFFKAQAHGGTMDILNLGIVKSLPMPLPPIGEQREIIDEIDRRHSLVRGVEAGVDTNLKRAQALRHATLVGAFGINVK